MKHCSRDVTPLSAEGVFFLIIEELHGQNSAVSLKLKEALMSRRNEGRQKTLIWLVKYINNGKMHSTESRSSGHSDTNLEALPAKSARLSAAIKDFSFAFMMKTVTKCLLYPIPKECLTLSQSTKIKAEQQSCLRN